MDRQHALDGFLRYVGDYDPDNPRIRLKIDHTLRVAPLCERIATSLGLPAPEVDLAWLAGLLHDIGRFEQVRRYDTFNDAASLPHAALSASVLFDDPGPDGRPLIRSFVEDDTDDGPLRIAIASHSDLRLPVDLDPRTRRLCELLRDADKIDILKVNCVCPIEDIYAVSEGDMRASRVSPACVELFYQHTCLPRGVRRHPADIMLGHICFAWEIVHGESLAIMREQGHLGQMLSRHWDLPETEAAFREMERHMRRELGL